MSVTSRIRPSVEAARARLLEGRRTLRDQHQQAPAGYQICEAMADLMEAVVLDAWREALGELEAEALEGRLALVAYGGLGRRDVAPFSDTDLMVLHAPGDEERVTPVVRRFTQQLYDTGLQLGFSTRTPQEACQWAAKDATVFTSLVESRRIAGSEALFAAYWEAFLRERQRRGQVLVVFIDDARREERVQYGETVYLLCPNVKRSRGGLRDIHLIRWLGFAVFGVTDLAALESLGALVREERRKLQSAHEFLLRLRNDLHFHAGKPQDLLSRNEQVRMAPLYGCAGDSGLLPVEQFMRLYFEHTSDVRYASSNLVAAVRARPTVAAFFGRLFSRTVDGDYLIGPVHIAATRRGLQKLRGDLSEVLRLMDLANMSDKRIDYATWQAIRQEMLEREQTEVSREATKRFLSLLSQPARLGDLLRRLHQLRVLEKLVPPMRHARNLLQFNEYHKYTIDEHCIRAVEKASEFLQDPGPVGEAYRQIREKRTLHLALLLHDLGKGFAREHCEVGFELAQETARHLSVPPREANTIATLVKHHLRMCDVAFRHDLNNESVILSFAAQVGSIEVLQLMFVHTCADLAAVGPGTLNDWKLELLTELYERTREQLSGDYQGTSARQRTSALREKLIAEYDDPERQPWWSKQIRSLPAGYLAAGSAERILDELRRLAVLPRSAAVAWGRYLPERQAVEYTVGTYEEIVPGIFHRLTGVLSSTGHSILSAEIHTLADNLVLDRFFVHDLDFAGPPPADRIEKVCGLLERALQAPSEERPTFRRVWQKGTSRDELPRTQPEQVVLDNATSEQHTIVTVFAYDRVGLLYGITRALYELGLSVHVARIATHLDQVVDVFYVTTAEGGQVLEESRLEEIRSRVLLALHDDTPAQA